MKTQNYSVLIRRSQSGDAAARKKLLMESYMRIAYQCRHILLNQSSAETITRDILRTLHRMLEELENPDDYLPRMQEMIAEKTAFWLAERDWDARDQKSITLPGKLLDENQTALFVMRLADGLPADQRLCIVLKHCGEMECDVISISTGISAETVQTAIEEGERALEQRLEEYRQQEIKLLGLGSLDLMLTGAMEASRNEMTAAAVAESVMGTIRPKKTQSTPAKKSKKANKKVQKENTSGLAVTAVILLIAVICLTSYILYLG